MSNMFAYETCNICAIKMLMFAITRYPKEFLLQMIRASSRKYAFPRHINFMLGNI